MSTKNSEVYGQSFSSLLSGRIEGCQTRVAEVQFILSASVYVRQNSSF